MPAVSATYAINFKGKLLDQIIEKAKKRKLPVEKLLWHMIHEQIQRENKRPLVDDDEPAKPTKGK